MLVRLEGVSGWELKYVAGRPLRGVLRLAGRIAEDIGMSPEQRCRQEIVFARTKPRGLFDFSFAYVDPGNPTRVVIQVLYWFNSGIGDFEATLVEELQHAVDFYRGLGIEDPIVFWTPYYASHVTEFRAVVQMARLRPIPAVRRVFRKAVTAVVEDSRVGWCGTIDPNHLRQAVVNAQLPQELIQSLARALRAASFHSHALALSDFRI